MGHVPRDAGLLATVLRASEHVRTERSAGIGRITLDRPAKLNALTFEMVRETLATLAAWESDPDVRAVLLDGAGSRGFCAGGDIGALYGLARTDERARTFWREEYRVVTAIARYVKPVVVLMRGIVMGGGVGLASHARFPIVTDSTRLAMPEVNIGFIPDVGTTWLLARAPRETGTYLALTGAHVGAADALELGLAKFFVPEADLEALTAAFLREAPRDDADVSSLVCRFATDPVGPSVFAEQRSTIERAFARGTVEEIVRALQSDGSQFALASAREMAAKSPTSLKLTLRALREARDFECMDDAIRLEYRLMSRLVHEHDFQEGVRAAIVDKDRRPAWQPATLDEVSPEAVDTCFTSLGEDELRL